MDFEQQNDLESVVKIKVIGVGGGGSNAVDHMINAGVTGVEFVAINTDKQALRKSQANIKLAIGEKTTRGFGAGSNPQAGAAAAEESIDEIENMLQGTDMVFITAGMGGGTGTGAAPIIARKAREMDILTVAVVTKPFEFEMQKRMTHALEGIKELSGNVDSLIVIPNEKLLQLTQKITFIKAFQAADDILRQGVESISSLIVEDGYVNLDFADVTNVMANAGYAHMGMGIGTGKDKADECASSAIASPLLETSIKGAKGVLINFTISEDVGADEVKRASEFVQHEASPDANVIWGIKFDPTLTDEMRMTIVATGFDKKPVIDIPVPNASTTVTVGANTNISPSNMLGETDVVVVDPQKKKEKDVSLSEIDDWLNKTLND